MSGVFDDAAESVQKGARLRSSLGNDLANQVDETIERAASGTIRFPGHDGKQFKDVNGALPEAELGYYTEWTVAASGAKRGTDRLIIGGSPANPDAIFYWDHAGSFIQVYP